MKENNFKKGRAGEKFAESYLIEKGFVIIDRNFKTRYGEIDLIAAKSKILHFIEVKLKVGDNFGAPEEMVNKRKILQVVKTAESYLLLNRNYADKFKRFLVGAVCVVVNPDGSKKRINYYDNLTVDL